MHLCLDGLTNPEGNGWEEMHRIKIRGLGELRILGKVTYEVKRKNNKCPNQRRLVCSLIV